MNQISKWQQLIERKKAEKALKILNLTKKYQSKLEEINTIVCTRKKETKCTKKILKYPKKSKEKRGQMRISARAEQETTFHWKAKLSTETNPNPNPSM